MFPFKQMQLEIMHRISGKVNALAVCSVVLHFIEL